MKTIPFLRTLAVSALFLTLASPLLRAEDQAKDHDHQHGEKSDVKGLIAVLQPTAGNDVSGQVIFKDLGDGKVEVTAKVEGLEPDFKHGFHVHEYGDLTAVAQAVIGVMNPGD